MIKYIIAISLITLVSCNGEADKKNEETEMPQKELEVHVKDIYENEEFKEINPDEFNQQLAEKEEDLSAGEVMKLFYPYTIETEEGNQIIELSEDVSANGNVVVTLIHDNRLDDSVKGEKYIMELMKSDNKWTVLSLKKNWKCWEGRGHTEWGIELCN